MKPFLLFFLGAILSTGLYAQTESDTNKTEQLEFCLEVFDVISSGGNIYKGSIAKGSDFGLKNRMKGSLLTRYESGHNAHNELKGTAVVTDVSKNQAIINIEIDDDASSEPRSGDLVIFQIEKEKVDRSIFFDMYRLQIGINDINLSPFYSEEEVLESNGGFQEYIIQKIVEDIIYVAGAMKEQMEEPMIEGGLYNGTGLFDAMEASTSRNLLSFFLFVKENPQKYIGGDWKVSEIYATWLFSNSPLECMDFFDLYQDISGKNDRISFVDKIGGERIYDCIDTWRQHAEALIEARKFGKAEHVLDLSLEIAMHTMDNNNTASLFYSYADLYHSQEKYKKAIKYFEQALELFTKTENYASKLFVLNDMGISYKMMGKSDNAASCFSEALRLAKELNELAESKILNPIISLTSRNLGDIYTDKEEYETALSYYNEAVSLDKELNTTLSVKRLATTYLSLSELYRKMGKIEKANEYENKAIRTYKKIM